MDKKNKKIKKYFNKGFSLMETLIWVAIVGVFLGLVAFVGFPQIDRAKVKGAKQDLHTFRTVLLEYESDVGQLPTEEEGLMILIQKEYVLPKANGKLPDPWGNEYIYTLINDGKDFTIKSLGSDKQEGGEGTKKDLIISSTNTGESGDSNGLDYGS